MIYLSPTLFYDFVIWIEKFFVQRVIYKVHTVWNKQLNENVPEILDAELSSEQETIYFTVICYNRLISENSKQPEMASGTISANERAGFGTIDHSQT